MGQKQVRKDACVSKVNMNGLKIQKKKERDGELDRGPPEPWT